MTGLFYLRARGGQLFRQDACSFTNSYIDAGVFSEVFVGHYRDDGNVEVIPTKNVINYLAKEIVATEEKLAETRQVLRAAEKQFEQDSQSLSELVSLKTS